MKEKWGRKKRIMQAEGPAWWGSLWVLKGGVLWNGMGEMSDYVPCVESAICMDSLNVLVHCIPMGGLSWNQVRGLALGGWLCSLQFFVAFKKYWFLLNSSNLSQCWLVATLSESPNPLGPQFLCVRGGPERALFLSSEFILFLSSAPFPWASSWLSSPSPSLLQLSPLQSIHNYQWKCHHL